MTKYTFEFQEKYQPVRVRLQWPCSVWLNANDPKNDDLVFPVANHSFDRIIGHVDGRVIINETKYFDIFDCAFSSDPH